MGSSSFAFERFVLRDPLAGAYLSVAGQDEHIETVTSPQQAWTFRTHEGAVTHAIWIGQVLGITPEVEMLR